MHVRNKVVVILITILYVLGIVFSCAEETVNDNSEINKSVLQDAGLDIEDISLFEETSVIEQSEIAENTVEPDEYPEESDDEKTETEEYEEKDLDENIEDAEPVAELEGLRDYTSKTYLLADGQYQYVGYGDVIHYKDENGLFRDIISTITDDTGREDYKYSNTENFWRVYFKDTVTEPGQISPTE